MHEMPDDWQQRMAELIHEFDATWKGEEMPAPHVVARENGRNTRWPEWLLNYRHPDFARIDDMRSNVK